MHRAVLPALFLLLGACVEEEAEVVRVLVPDDVELHWDDSFNGADDGIAAVVPVDVMVYVDETGEPLEGVQLELSTDAPDAVAVSVDDVLIFEGDDCADCELTWDAYRDRYVEIFGGPTGGDGAVLQLVTDVDGIARAYIHVDAFPYTDTEIAAVVVRVSMGTA
ncbi:MAG: hypothetical protein ACI9K2_006525, partial [Myxococcota bacterium]